MRERGSALILVIVIIAAGMALTGILLRNSDVDLRLGWLFRTKAKLELAAESGIALARSDLLKRSELLDFTNPDGSSSTELSGQQGLWRSGIQYPLPRFETESKGLRVKVTYFPSEANPGVSGEAQDLLHNQGFPKIFRVISEARNTKTGEAHTIETMFQMRFENSAEIAYGMLHGTLPPDLEESGELRFLPAVFDGHVHFPSANIMFWYGDFVFKGPATFSGGDLPGIEHPFRSTEYNTRLDFQMGYRKNYELKFKTDVYNQLVSQSTLDLSHLGEVCLKFRETEVDVYPANPASFDFRTRCIGETPESGGAGPIATYPNAGILYSSHPLHLKGIVRGKSTVVAERAYLEGDLVHADQSRSSADRFGIVTLHDIIVARTAPAGNLRFGFADNGERSDMYENITNFKVANDRDIEREAYVGEDGLSSCRSYVTAWLNNDCDNAPSTLDIDAAMLAIEGELEVEGINDYETNPTNGLSIPAKDPVTGEVKLYTLEMDKPNSYFTMVDGVRVPKGEPLFCGEYDETGDCLPEAGLPRHYAFDLWIYGSLVTDDFAKTGHSYLDEKRLGFQRKVMFSNPAFRSEPPPGFPYTQNVSFEVLWTKSYGGSAPLVAVK